MTASETARAPSRLLPLILIGLGLILIGASAFYLYQNNPPRADVGVVPAVANYPAPELTLTDLDGATHSLADYRGQVVLVNLWATWCEPCKEEMPALQAFYDKQKENGFVIIAINDGDPKEDVLQFVKDYQLTFPIWLDPTYIATEQAFKTLGLPSSYVIDRSGMIRLRWMGGIERKTLEKYVTPIIAEEP
ncbi:MAG: Thiol-disulfide oxidoreductase ResA [Anaerolineales bacterium]|nr:Thiol-disulfide oxidoreductase ResA [Anaerolineales bacterium]WKZ48142.1 MAG: TlpA disulfide reductase family protein [Anaerolineales bacterium]